MISSNTLAVGQPLRQLFTRGARSKGDQQPGGPVAHWLRQREEWIRFSYSNEDTKDEERRKGWVVLNVVQSAKRARCPGCCAQQTGIHILVVEALLIATFLSG